MSFKAMPASNIPTGFFFREDKLWIPDPFIENGRKEMKHDVTVPNFYMRVYPNGTIRYDLRYKSRYVFAETSYLSLPAACWD